MTRVTKQKILLAHVIIQICIKGVKIMDISLKKEETKVITFRVNCNDCDLIDYLIARYTDFPSRSVFIREAIDEKIESTLNSKGISRG